VCGRCVRYSGRAPTFRLTLLVMPLKGPGCDAYDAAHLGGELTLRELERSEGTTTRRWSFLSLLIASTSTVSCYGGDPLVRFGELEIMFPKFLLARGNPMCESLQAPSGLGSRMVLPAVRGLVVSNRWLAPSTIIRRAPAT